MRLLITTQEVDSEGPLGFFVRWIEEFAKHCESVEVICLREGAHNLPQNVHIHSLGKEKGPVSRVRYVGRFFRALTHVGKYDAVFVHMNPEYVVLAGWWWCLRGRRIGLWYVHKSVNWVLRIATLFVTNIFTVSRESFRLASKKVREMGHGIDASIFLPHTPRTGPIRLITTGRISPTKDIMRMLAITDCLYVDGTACTLRIIGAPGTDEDRVYETLLRQEIAAKPYADLVEYIGPVPHTQIPRHLSESDVYLNFSKTGSADKGVLEALCADVPAVTTNPGLRPLIPSEFFVPADKPQALAQAVVRVADTDMGAITQSIRAQHDLSSLIRRIYTILAA